MSGTPKIKWNTYVHFLTGIQIHIQENTLESDDEEEADPPTPPTSPPDVAATGDTGVMAQNSLISPVMFTIIFRSFKIILMMDSDNWQKRKVGMTLLVFHCVDRCPG